MVVLVSGSPGDPVTFLRWMEQETKTWKNLPKKLNIQMKRKKHRQTYF